MTSPGALAAPSDEELLAAHVAGDEQAFTALVERYEQRVYAICLRYFGNPSDAQDAAQDAFVALLRRAGTFRGTSSFATWMYRVAVNACNDLARKRSRRPRPADVDVERLADDLAGPDAAEQLAARDLDPDLAAALRELDAATREAVVLHDVYGVGYAEIARRSGAALGTVKSRIHRGHARLARSLTGAAASERARGREPYEQPRPPTSEP